MGISPETISDTYANLDKESASQNSLEQQMRAQSKEMGVDFDADEDTIGFTNLDTISEEELEAQSDAMARQLGIKDIKEDEPIKPQPTIPPGKQPELVAEKELVTEEALADPAKQLVGGVLDTFEQLGKAAVNTTNFILKHAGETGFSKQDLFEEIPVLNFSEELIPKSKTDIGRFARVIGKFLAPLGTTGMAVKGAAAVRLTKAATISAGVDFALFDPNEERLSNFIQENPEFANFISARLAHKEGETELEGRVKNGIEGLMFGGIVGGAVVGGVKAFSALTEGFDSYLKGVRRLRKSKGVQTEEELKPFMVTDEKSAFKNLPEQAAIVDMTRLKEDVDISDITQVSLLKLGEEPDFNVFIKRFVKDNEDAILKSKRGPTTLKEIEETADELLQDPEEIMRVLSKKEGEPLNPIDLTIARKLFKAATDDALVLARKAQAGKPEDLAAYIQGSNTLMSISRKVLAAQEGIAQSQRSGAIVIGEFGELERAKYIANVIKFEGGAEKIRESANMLVTIASNPLTDFTREVGKIAKKSLGRKVFDTLREMQVNNLLFAPATQFVNLGSGVVIGGASLGERMIARQFTKLRQAKELKAGVPVVPGIEKGEVAIATKIFFSETAGQTMAGLNGLWDGFKLAGRMLKDREEIAEWVARGKKVPERLSGYSIDARDIPPSITAEEWGLGGFFGKAVDVYGAMQRTPTRMLMRGDDMVGAIHYRTELNSLAHREVMRQGLEGEEATKLYKQITEGNTENLNNKSIRDHIESIRSQAAVVAETNKFTKELDGLPKRIDELIKQKVFGVSALRTVFPFIRTQMNIAQYGFERTPLEPIMGKFKTEIAAGGARADMARAKVAMGSSFMTFAALYGYDGLITGSEPANPEARAFLRATGSRPGSILLGDEYVDFSRVVEPFTSFLTLGVDIAAIAGDAMAEDQKFEIDKLGAAAVVAVAEAMTPEFLTTTMTDLFDIISSQNPRKMSALARGLATGFVPASGLLREIRKGKLPFSPQFISDPIMRDTTDTAAEFKFLQEMLNSIKNIIPGWSKSLPPRRTMFGDPIHYPHGWGPDIASPIAFSPKLDSPIRQEMIRLGVVGLVQNPVPISGETHLMVDMPNRVMTKFVGGQPVSVPLNPKQYDRFVVLSAGIGLEGALEGLTLEKFLNQEIRQGWPNLDGLVNDENKRVFIKSIVNEYRGAAREQLSLEEPDLEEKLNKLIEQKIDVRTTVPRINIEGIGGQGVLP